MKPSLPEDVLARGLEVLRVENAKVLRRWPGEPSTRQPVHTVYGSAHIYTADSAQELGRAALADLEHYAPDFATFARAIGLAGADLLPLNAGDVENLSAAIDRDPENARRIHPHAFLAHLIHRRVREKLLREPVEDQRVDFEDGYGNRNDAEEDGHAVSAAEEMARGFRENLLPPFVGIRIKPLSDELARRSLRTTDLFVSTLVKATGGRLPPNFVITLSKITTPAQVSVLADVLDALEQQLGLASGVLKIEYMIEVTQSIGAPNGESQLPQLLDAARGRCTGAHFGTYDYTASCNVTAAHQHMGHSACDFAKHAMQVAYAQTGIFLSDGATGVMPVPIHKGPSLTQDQANENRAAIHRAWRLHAQDVRRSLVQGFFQGWDMHPAQLPTRYAAVFAFFLESLPAASDRLANFLKKTSQATLLGDVWDDAATGQALLNFFLRGVNSGAITEEEAQRTGLTLEELRGRSFAKILRNRRASKAQEPR